MPNDFQIAAERARQRFGEKAWDALTSHQRSDAIYKELHAIDAERIRKAPVTSGGDC